MPCFLLDHILKVDLMRPMFPFYECHFFPIGTTFVKHFSPTVIVIMEPKRVSSRDTTKIIVGEAVEKALVKLPLYVDTQMFKSKDSTPTWKNFQ